MKLRKEEFEKKKTAFDNAAKGADANAKKAAKQAMEMAERTFKM